MDFRINAFVGSLSVLRDWRRHIPSALVVALTDDLGLVPVTSAFRQDLRRHLKAEAQSEKEVIELWGVQASEDCTLAYISADYFADFYSDGIDLPHSNEREDQEGNPDGGRAAQRRTQ